MSLLDRLYRPDARGFLAWSLLAAVGWFLDGPVGTTPALIVAIVAAARLDRSVLGIVGVVLVGAAGVVVLLDSSGGAADVNLRFVTRSMAPHHLTFIGLTLVIVRMVLEAGSRRDPVAVHPEVSDPGDRRDEVDEPLATRSAGLRIGIVVLVVIVAGLAALGVSAT